MGRWYARSATAIVVLATVALLLLDLTDGSFRRWWTARSLTTDTVAGIMVVLITVLVVDQLVRARQLKERSRAVAAQALIVIGQARRAAQAVSSALDGSGERDAAVEEVRTYMTMLLIAAPLLIDAKLARTFLEAAQSLAGELARALYTRGRPSAPAETASGRIDEAVKRLRGTADPLMKILAPQEQAMVSGAPAT